MEKKTRYKKRPKCNKQDLIIFGILTALVTILTMCMEGGW